MAASLRPFESRTGNKSPVKMIGDFNKSQKIDKVNFRINK
jgi:hypothetical protein